MNYAVEQRLVFIDFLLFEYGHVKHSALIEYFGIAEATASRDLSLYRSLAPENMASGPRNINYKTADFKRLYK